MRPEFHQSIYYNCLLFSLCKLGSPNIAEQFLKMNIYTQKCTPTTHPTIQVQNILAMSLMRSRIQNKCDSISGFVWFMVFNATFNNISVICISWESVLLVEETGENNRPVASHWQTLSNNVLSSTPHLRGVWTHVSGDRHWLHRQF